MKTVRDVMTTDLIWLSPENRVKTAIILIKGRAVGCLPVLDGDQIAGVLYYHDILGKDPEIPVQHIMNREFVTVPPVMLVTDAADLMAKIGNGRLLVTDGGKLVGIVTRGDLLPEIGKSLDPLTGLLRVDAMRDWGINVLKSGQEITVIFVDLDQLRVFNKKYGHIIGDKAIKHIADTMAASVNEETDLLCRYAGDEFVIVTTRPGDEARALAEYIGRRIRETPNPDIPEPVTGSVGVYGGKRTRERDHIHYEATLDALINLASKACTLEKNPVETATDGAGAPVIEAAPEPVITPAPVPAPAAPTGEWQIKIQSLNLSWGAGETATAEVELSDGAVARKGARNGFAAGNGALRLIADAAADAIMQFLPAEGFGIIAENVHIVRCGGSDDIVLVTLLFVTPQKQTRLSGSAIVKQDTYRATASAVLDAINKQMSTLA
jgi:IMP dehydrogenase